MRRWQIIETTPGPVTAHLKHSRWRWGTAGRREGVDIATDPRPRVLVAAYVGVMRTAWRHWGTGAGISLQAARSCTESSMDELTPAPGSDGSNSRPG